MGRGTPMSGSRRNGETDGGRHDTVRLIVSSSPPMPWGWAIARNHRTAARAGSGWRSGCGNHPKWFKVAPLARSRTARARDGHRSAVWPAGQGVRCRHPDRGRRRTKCQDPALRGTSRSAGDGPSPSPSIPVHRWSFTQHTGPASHGDTHLGEAWRIRVYVHTRRPGPIR